MQKISDAILEIINRREKSPRNNTIAHQENEGKPASIWKTPFLNKETAAKLNKILANRKLVKTGQVKLLGLENLQKRLGSKWQALLENIHESMISIIKKRISEKDVFFNKSESEFIIVFASASHDVAQLLCAKILQELNEKFAGSSDTKDIIVKTATQEVNGEIFYQQEDLNSILGHINPEDMKNPDVQKKTGATNSWASSLEIDDEVYEFGFRPVWDSRVQVITTYHVNACSSLEDVSENIHGQIKTGYNVLTDKSSIEAVMGLDWVTLMCSINALEDLFKHNFRAIFNIPLCYETVFTTELLLAYASRCNIIPPILRKYIVFSLVNFPKGIPAAKLRYIVSTLKNYSRAVLVETPSIDLHLEKYRDCGIKAISIKIADHGLSPKKAWNQIIPFANICHKNKIQVSLLDVNTLEDLFIANENNVDFISGNVIGKYKNYAAHMQKIPLTELISRL